MVDEAEKEAKNGGGNGKEDETKNERDERS